MTQQIYLWILRAGSWLALFSVFIVAPRLLFPYITGKQIYFNILLEVLAVAWIALIVKYPEWRPKKSLISWGLLAYFAIVLVTCFTGVDFNLSFWGDIERMLGWFHLAHFLIFYFILITVMRRWQDWRNLLIFSVAVAALNCIYGMGRTEAWMTIGNTAYVSGYLIFNMFFAVLLFLREPNKVWRWGYLAPLPLLLQAFVRADTTGAAVGMMAGIAVMFSVILLFAKDKRLRFGFLGAFIVLITLTSFLFANRQEPWLKNTTIGKILVDISFNKYTFQTRLISWRGAYRDFANHPLLGTGHGNYAVTFDKYFDPKFYTHSESETYFDRAHNNLIDIVSTTGILGLIAYLSVFVAVAYYLIIAYRRDRLTLAEFSLLTGLITAYFVQNLAVFDSLATYIGLMITLGLISWLGRAEEEEIKAYNRPFENKEIVALAVAGILSLLVIYNYNYQVLQMLVGTIDGQRSANNLDVATQVYRQALSYKTGLDRDSRTSLIRLYVGNLSALQKMERSKAEANLEYAIGLAQANVDYNPHDTLNQLMLAQIYNLAADFYSQDQAKFDKHLKLAEEAINKSIAASPGRVTNYYYQAQIYLNKKDMEQAIKTLEYAVSLNENYSESRCHLGKILLFYKQEERGLEEIGKCVDLGGAYRLSPASLVKSVINQFAAREEYDRVGKLFKQLIALEPNVADNYVNLAKLFKLIGDKEQAKAAAQKAAEIDPAIKDQAEQFIRGL